jgi:hypothetical protein
MIITDFQIMGIMVLFILVIQLFVVGMLVGLSQDARRVLRKLDSMGCYNQTHDANRQEAVPGLLGTPGTTDRRQLPHLPWAGATDSGTGGAGSVSAADGRCGCNSCVGIGCTTDGPDNYALGQPDGAPRESDGAAGKVGNPSGAAPGTEAEHWFDPSDCQIGASGYCFFHRRKCHWGDVGATGPQAE